VSERPSGSTHGSTYGRNPWSVRGRKSIKGVKSITIVLRFSSPSLVNMVKKIGNVVGNLNLEHLNSSG